MLGEDPVSFQMPFYYHLAEENGMDVCFLSYYDIEKPRFIHIIHPSASRTWTDPEGMEEISASMVRAAENMAKGVREGRFTVPDDDRGCTHCRYRMVCRELERLRSDWGAILSDSRKKL